MLGSTTFFRSFSLTLLFPGVLAAALLAALLLPPRAARGQTPAATVKDGGGTVVLQSNVDGGLLAPGTFNSGTIPATGSGTRMMWYPKKAAFRAGRVGVSSGSGSNWDPADVGDYSVAFGRDTRALDNGAMAVGFNTNAAGTAAMAMGLNTEATGTAATAMGDATDARGSRSVAMNIETTAKAPNAVAMGDRTIASGGEAVAMGFKTTASGADAVAMGNRTAASARGTVAMGDQTTASALDAVAMGFNTEAASEQSLTIGECSDANRSADNSLFVAGNGTFSLSQGTCTTRSDALVLDRNGDMTIAGSLTQSSDRRLKTGITPLGENVLQKLADLRPVRFEFKDQRTHPSSEQIGLIAQDVRTEFPSLVSEGRGGYLSLAYPKLTAVLLKGLQEQQARIEKRKGQIADLKSRVASLKAEYEAGKKQRRTLEKRLARLESKVKAQSNGSVLAGVSTSGLWTLLLVLGAFGAGLLWRRRADVGLRLRP